MIQNDHATIQKEKKAYQSLPEVRMVDEKAINTIYQIIKQDVQDIVELMMEEILNDPQREFLIVKKNNIAL